MAGILTVHVTKFRRHGARNLHCETWTSVANGARLRCFFDYIYLSLPALPLIAHMVIAFGKTNCFTYLYISFIIEQTLACSCHEMQISVLTVLCGVLVPTIVAKGGGGKGGGGGGGGGHSKTLVCANCRSDMQFMYGHRTSSVFTDIEIIAQLGIYLFWILILLGAYLRFRKVPAVMSRLAIATFVSALIFLIVRYGLIFANISVPIGYRHESSIVDLLYWLGITCLLISISGEIEFNRIQGLVNIFLNGSFACLSLTYIVYDFLISEQASDHHMLTKEWWLSDREFGLVLDPANVRKLLGQVSGFSPTYIKSRMLDSTGSKYSKDRSVAIQIGVASDSIGLSISGLLVGMIAWKLLKKRGNQILCPVSSNNTERVPSDTDLQTRLLVAASGLLFSFAYRLFISTYFVLHNWAVVKNEDKWDAWAKSYVSTDEITKSKPQMNAASIATELLTTPITRAFPRQL